MRRESGASPFEACTGNSISSSSPNAFSSESSSKVRQYFGPLASASFLRTASSSMLAGLISLAEIRLGFISLLLDIRIHLFPPYRWQVEQLVMSCSVRRGYFCRNALPSSNWLVYGLPSSDTV